MREEKGEGYEKERDLSLPNGEGSFCLLPIGELAHLHYSKSKTFLGKGEWQ